LGKVVSLSHMLSLHLKLSALCNDIKHLAFSVDSPTLPDSLCDYDPTLNFDSFRKLLKA